RPARRARRDGAAGARGGHRLVRPRRPGGQRVLRVPPVGELAGVTAALDLGADGAALTAALVDVPSVSGTEAALASAIERALRRLDHHEVRRDGDAVLAR